jgi:hypothetical protein
METFIADVSLHYDSFSWLIVAGVAITYFVADALYAEYTVLVSERQAVKAATTGALLHFVLALGVLSYVDNYLYIVPIAIGSWFGTYVLVNRNSKK